MRTRLVGTVLLLSLGIALRAWAGFDEAVAAYTRGDYATAVREWLPLAQQGNANAQHNLGVMYDTGKGVPQDYAQALTWYRRAADQGHAKAQYNVGVMYHKGQGVPQNYSQAVQWYRKAVEQGEGDAQNNLGTMYHNGEGVPQDYQQAYFWDNLAAAQKASNPTDHERWVRNRDMVAALLTPTQLAHAQAQALPPVAAASPTQAPAAPPAFVPPLTPVSTSPPPPPVAAASPTEASHRRALVIGNAAYPDVPFRNPINDATDMATILRRVGFEVTLLRDADKSSMERAVQDFTKGVPWGSVGLFFFAGHGAQIDGLNYLIPIGAALGEPSDGKYRAVAADWVLGRMDDTGMEVKLLILDACRNNPFGRSWTRAIDRGLATMDTPKGSLIAYATSPKKKAADGTGRNSPYTAHLLRQIPIAGRQIELMFKAVRVGVEEETQGQQTPWEASSLTGEFYFQPAPGGGMPATATESRRRSGKR